MGLRRVVPAAIAAFVLFGPVPCAADLVSPGDRKPERVSGVRSLQERVDDDIVSGIDLFYDIQPDAALAMAAELTERHPRHPAGPFLQSMVFYQRFLFEDPARPETVREFEVLSTRGLAAAQAWLSTSPAVGNLYLAAGYGYLARVRAHQGELSAALKHAKRSLLHSRRAVEADPGLDDAYLGIGMYNYFVSRIPAAAKPFAFMATGMWPDRDEGLAQIARVAEKGGAARVEARGVLASIYSSRGEKRWTEADAMLAGLMERYPRNPYFRLRRVYVAQSLGRWKQALADPDGDWVKALAPLVRPGALAAARYRAAETLLLWGRPDEAREHLRSLQAAAIPSSLWDWVQVRLMNLLQAEGRHEEAAKVYPGLTNKSARKAAKKFLSNPYPRGPKTVSPLRWPLNEVPR